MDAKHTPGPWMARPVGKPSELEVSADGWVAVAQRFSKATGEPLAVGAANARLIAAAPELLEALERALNFIANTESELGITLESGDAARAAITKATGQ